MLLSLCWQVLLDETRSQVIEFSVIWSSSPDSVKYKSYVSLPEIVEFPTEVPGQNAYAYFYPPSNHTFQAGLEERPPLLLRSHGKNTLKRERIVLCLEEKISPFNVNCITVAVT